MDVNFGLKIKQLMESRNEEAKQLAEGIGYSTVGVYDILKKEDVSTLVLKKVSKYYGVDMAYFLSENVNIRQKGKVNSVGENTVFYGNRINSSVEDKQRIELLETELKGAKSENALLRDMIEMLKKQIK